MFSETKLLFLVTRMMNLVGQPPSEKADNIEDIEWDQATEKDRIVIGVSKRVISSYSAVPIVHFSKQVDHVDVIDIVCDTTQPHVYYSSHCGGTVDVEVESRIAVISKWIIEFKPIKD